MSGVEGMQDCDNTAAVAELPADGGAPALPTTLLDADLTPQPPLPRPALQNITTLTAGQQVPLTSLWGPMDTQALALGYLANDTVPVLLQ